MGPCRATKKRFFFNVDSGTCESFNYGGCMGNTNNFQTLMDCTDRCGVVPENVDDAVAVVSVSLTDNVETSKASLID